MVGIFKTHGKGAKNMKKQTKTLLAWLMTLVMCLTTFAPTMTVLAAGESQQANATDESISSLDLNEQAANTENKTIVNHDFEDVTLNTTNGYGSFNVAAIAQSGGIGLQANGTGSINIKNGQLALENMPKGSFVDLQLFYCGYANTDANPINRDFVLSFDIQIGSTSVNYNGISIRDNAENKWITPIYVNGGKIHITGANANLSTTEMTHVEVVFNYDSFATNNDSTTGAFTSVTVTVNGKKLGTVALDRSAANLKYINHFRMFQYWGAESYESLILDNLYVGFGKGNQDADAEKNIVRHDFEDVTINTTNGYGSFNVAAMATTGGIGLQAQSTGSISIKNGQLALENMPTQSFVDLQLYYCGYSNTGGNPINRDFVLSFDIQIDSTSVNYNGISIRDNGEDKWITPIYVNSGKIHIAGANADLSTTEMTHVEVVFNYNPIAKNTDSTMGAFTSLTLIVNGKEIGTAALDRSVANLKYINHFRMFQYWGSTPYESIILDNLCVDFGKGNRGVYAGGKTLYDIDFTEPEFEGHTEMNKTVNGMRILNPGYYDAELSGIQNDILKMVGSGGHCFIDAHVDMGNFEKKDLTVTMFVRPVGLLSTAFFSLPGNNGVITGSGTTLSIGGNSKTLSSYRFSCVEVVLLYDYNKMEYNTARLYVDGEYVGSNSNLVGLKAISYFRLANSYGAGQGLEMDSFKVTTGTEPLYKGEPTVTDFIGYQTSAVENHEYNVRLLAVLTDENVENYRNVGFKVSIAFADDTVKKMPFETGVCTTVYSAVTASVGVNATYTAETLGGASIFALNCVKLPVSSGAATFTVTLFYTPAGEETAIEERTLTFTVEKKEETKVLDLYLIGGQSNAAGSSLHNGKLDGIVFENVGYAGQINRQYKNGNVSGDFLYSFSQYQWSVSAGFGKLSTIGPEFGMAEVFNEYYTGDEKAFIFKSAAGGTALVTPSTSEFGTWLPSSMWAEGYDPVNTTDGLGFQYYSFVENFAQVYWTLRDNGYDVRIKGMAWMQGEADLYYADQYGDALMTMIRDLRADLYAITGDESVKEMPFVIGKIATSFAQYDNPVVPGFNAVQQSVADNTVNCETIETADLIIVGPDGQILGSDHYHFNYSDSRTLGNRFAQKLMEMNGMEIQ